MRLWRALLGVDKRTAIEDIELGDAEVVAAHVGPRRGVGALRPVSAHGPLAAAGPEHDEKNQPRGCVFIRRHAVKRVHRRTLALLFEDWKGERHASK